MGRLLSLCESQENSDRAGKLGPQQAALRAIEAPEAGQIDRRLPERPGCPLGALLDDGGVWQRLVADGPQSRCPRGDE